MIETAILGAGVVIGAIGQLYGASAQAEEARRQAAIKRMQAMELMNRMDTNQAILRRRGERVAMGMGEGFGAGAGSSLSDRAEALVELTHLISDQRREAEFKAKMLSMGADVDTASANTYQTAGYLNAGGTLLTGAVKTYKSLDANKGVI